MGLLINITVVEQGTFTTNAAPGMTLADLALPPIAIWGECRAPM
jgi:hypothetical protein